MSYLNGNGLVDGNIPAGQGCPFYEKCHLKMDRCPSTSNPNKVAFSCALARLNSLIQKTESEGTQVPLLKKVRNNL